METFPTHELVKLTDCKHPAQFDKECFMAALAVAGGQCCPDNACKKPLSLADALALDLGRQPTLNIAVKICVDAAFAREDWGKCQGKDCIGGAPLAAQGRTAFACRCCGSNLPLPRKVAVSFKDLSADDVASVEMLVASLAVGANPNERPIRECYHCGLQTEHRDACMAMKCPKGSGGCGEDWNFVTGPKGAHQFNLETARYVPRQSWLVDLGLYDGLTPGQLNVNVLPVVRNNLARLQAEKARVGSAQPRVSGL